MNELTEKQIAAGAAVLGDNGKPIGRNTAIIVADAMSVARSGNENNAGIDLDRLKRYDPELRGMQGEEYATMDTNALGGDYKVEDVRELLARRASATPSSKDAGAEPSDELLDMLGRIHPFAMDQKDRAKAYERLERAFVIQQPWPVPDQACIVWRADLMDMRYDLIHKQACFDSAKAERESAAPVHAAAAPSDPMDWPLPCDVKVGGVNIRQGCKLRTLVARMESLHRMAVKAIPEPTPEAREQGDGLSGTYQWLTRSARAGFPEVREAALTMMAYYQGAEFPEATVAGAGRAQTDFEPFTLAELDEIETAARAAPAIWYGTYQIIDGISDEKAVELIEACSPDSIITLVRQARAALARAPLPAQDGQVVDNARDAARWRFIVKDGKNISGRFTLVRADDSGRVDELHGGEYDRVIDAAMSASRQHDKGEAR